MKERAASWRASAAGRLRRPAQGGFRLTRYFTLTSLVAFSAVAVALYVLQRSEETFFDAVQQEQAGFFAAAQAKLAREQHDAARANLLAMHEAEHVNLANVVANALWERDFAPLVADAPRSRSGPCDGIAGPGAARGPAAGRAAAERCAVFPGTAGTGDADLPAIDARVRAMMRRSAVFKIKVYDLHGKVVYSSQASEIGEDKSGNAGWRSAIGGQAASELVHRDTFGAFEGVVENRDLIQTYVPVRAPRGDAIGGVFEIYSDVTLPLQQVERAAARIADITAANQAAVAAAALENSRKVEASSRSFFMILGGLLGLLYLATLLVVRSGQRIIDEQARAREAAMLREREWHREKMAALANMAANVSHEVGNPLMIISGLAEDLAQRQLAGESAAEQGRLIVEQTARIATMTRQIGEFATSRSEEPRPLDVNQMVRAVSEFLRFDARYPGVRFDFVAAPRLPACIGIADHLNEALMGLLQGCAEACAKQGAAARIRIETGAQGPEVVIRIRLADDSECTAGIAATDARLEIARHRVEGMGGRLEATGSAIDIVLPR